MNSYWELGNQNEIDIVAINEYEKTVIIADVPGKGLSYSFGRL
ncbi:MAG: DUF234 domain-containing protein [Dysgonamonadaceae bacterium]|nr:DUF234 domain-containing protein [Dysgonamonadaceae bacterium]